MGLFSFGKKSGGQKINWVNIDSLAKLDEVLSSGDEKPILFFKHSTRCSISAMALHGLEGAWDLKEEEVTPCFVDLIQHRDVSNKIEEITGVLHQSPQAIVLKKGEVIHQSSHNGIKAQQIRKAVLS